MSKQAREIPSCTAPQIQVLQQPAELFRAAAELFVATARRAVKDSGRFSVALCGGSTPRSLYSLLAEERAWRRSMPWKKSHFFWGDERHVPPSHAGSNTRMAMEAMLSKVPVPASNLHRIEGELAEADKAASSYERTLRKFFALAQGEYPRFDLVLLGIGSDGHTASLFPGTPALEERSRLVVSNRVEKLRTERITLTAPALNNAAHIVFLVTGADKAEALAAVFEGAYEPARFPAQLIRPARGRLTLLADAAAAGRLGRPRIRAPENAGRQ